MSAPCAVQATMGTRVWGVSSSARSLIFADGVPITALIANNNTIGGPRWGLIAPEEISRIDMMFGPFSAAYAGNSMGAVMEVTTRMPEKLEGSTLRIVQKAGVDGRLFGSVTNNDIADELNKQGYKVAKSQVRMPNGPIKTVGDSTVSVALHTDVVVDITVTVYGEST